MGTMVRAVVRHPLFTRRAVFAAASSELAQVGSSGCKCRRSLVHADSARTVSSPPGQPDLSLRSPSRDRQSYGATPPVRLSTKRRSVRRRLRRCLLISQKEPRAPDSQVTSIQVRAAMAILLKCVHRLLGPFLHSVTDVFCTLLDDLPRLLAGVVSGLAGFLCSLPGDPSRLLRRLVHSLGAVFHSTSCFLGRLLCDTASVLRPLIYSFGAILHSTSCFLIRPLRDTASVLCYLVRIGRDILCKPNCTQCENACQHD